MIIDTLDNIYLYKNFSDDIYKGLEFLQNVDPTINLGIYIINKRVKAIVEEYETDFNRPFEFESHKYVVDIQCPIIGVERVFWSPIVGMDIKTPYNENYDSRARHNKKYIDPCLFLIIKCLKLSILKSI